MKPSEVIANANKDFYAHDYERIIEKGGLLNRWIYKKTHEELERFELKNSQKDIHILELGAQSDQHRAWVKGSYCRYVVSDIDFGPLMNSKLKHETMLSKFGSKSAPAVPLISFEQIDAEQIGYPDNTFNRIIASCLIVHLNNPVDALHEWRRVSSDGGRIDLYVPCEPGLILRIARSLTHKRKNLSSQFSYDLLHYAQHKNHFPAINEFIKFVFADDTITKRFFPFSPLPWGFNLWVVYSVRINKTITG